jgi:hypothetical protein
MPGRNQSVDIFEKKLVHEFEKRVRFWEDEVHRLRLDVSEYEAYAVGFPNATEIEILKLTRLAIKVARHFNCSLFVAENAVEDVFGLYTK